MNIGRYSLTLSVSLSPAAQIPRKAWQGTELEFCDDFLVQRLWESRTDTQDVYLDGRDKNPANALVEDLEC
jgi:hypothetical protein